MRLCAAYLVLLLLGQNVLGDGRALAADAEVAADPENTLYLDLDSGRVVIRMRPDWAPKHVERIKHLARGGFFDGMVFHRVIDGFMAQTGDPAGTGKGGSGRTIEAEFTRTAQVRGIVSMARSSNKNSADSQWFIVLKDNRESLDGKYTAWGQVISGMEFIDRIKVGDAKRDGKVTNPDRLARLQVAADSDKSAQEKIPDAEILKMPATAAAARNFMAVEFRCLALDGRPGSAFQSAAARLWAHGYLAGYLKAQGKVTFNDDASYNSLDQACTAQPEAFLSGVLSSDLAKTTTALPATTAAFSPVQYKCKDFTAVRSAAAKAAADYVDLWSFAFIQGYKNVGQPGMEIPFETRPQLTGAIATACAKSPESNFFDLATLVASKVKLK